MQDELVALVRSYGIHSSPSQLAWPIGSFDDIQDFLIREIISSAHFATYPPSDAYQRSFWKWVIANVEGAGEEVQEVVYSHYLELLSRMRADSTALGCYAVAPPPSFVTYTWEDQLKSNEKEALENTFLLDKFRRCTLLEAQTVIQSGTTGLRSWTASFILADYILSQRETFQSARILELGSGAGFLGIRLGQMQGCLAGRAGDRINQPALFLTDFDDQVLDRCKTNLELPCNDLKHHPCLTVSKLDWEDTCRDDRRQNVIDFLSDADPDYIVGADLVYDISIIPALVNTLLLTLRNNPGDKERRALIAATVRNENTLKHFLFELAKAGLQVDIAQSSPPSENHFMTSLQKHDVVGAEVQIYQIR